YCARQRLASNLVASTEDVRLLVRARLKGRELPEDSLLTRGWRREHILPYLESFLDGRRSLRITDVRAEAPFDCPPAGARFAREPPASAGSPRSPEARG